MTSPLGPRLPVVGEQSCGTVSHPQRSFTPTKSQYEEPWCRRRYATFEKKEEERNAYSYEMIEGTNLSLNVLYSDSHFKGNSGFKSRSGSF